MEPCAALPRALLLLLFLHLSPLGGRPHPLGGRSPASEASEASEASGLWAVQELLGRLKDAVSELQAEQLALEPLHRSHSPAEAPEAGGTPRGVLAPHDSVLQALRRLRSPKMMHKSGCFGRRLDRIGSLSGLGCNVLRKY
uniref:Natriuretic peptides B n=1 Tax=Canis lupus familiaris TaxID=9615 RepID=ANFB_CANLF|nr:RecName: Full=Natriuretic peptides B; AltName: Full=Brain natriuretic factor prohormone; Short=preproBNP; Short=proBNP; AltName: Full=Gamma-brain natriuretic peptide; AltName: Full=Iso-ANP; Contains: RecName: Full=Brain natriuretic peptide 34; Short=BNP-34; Contains: RecName: Full=NT-proBNP; AltName: Full=NT-pro-BNP; AltName: Full=NT-proBNP(1-76); Contains: RecName: Full=Brain natriuretic peptide 32; Short=BNP(1-32); Short=BNP-32; AltName: Full=Brain natriuretic peptide; Short=BNP; Contains: Rec